MFHLFARDIIHNFKFPTNELYANEFILKYKIQMETQPKQKRKKRTHQSFP